MRRVNSLTVLLACGALGACTGETVENTGGTGGSVGGGTNGGGVGVGGSAGNSPLSVIVPASGARRLTRYEYDNAVLWSERAIQRHSENPEAYHVLASSLGHLGRVEDGRAALDACGRLIPSDSERPFPRWRFKHDADTEHFLDGLRKAGLTE